jgi:peptidoglycan hydrolase-like protein with peptidoglycan-binding domain
MGNYGFGAAVSSSVNPQTGTVTTTSDSVSSAAAAAVAAVTSATAAARRASIPAVATFQRAYGHGLTVDGIYGPATRAALATATGRTDLPAAGSSGGGGGGGGSSSTSTEVTPTPSDLDTSSGGGTTERPWLIPVAVVSTLVIVAGVVMLRRPVRANRRRRR